MIEAMRYYTQNQAAELLSVSRGTIINWRKAGRFPHIDRNGHFRIPQCCLDNNKDIKHPKGYDGKEVNLDDIVVKTTNLKNETAYLNAKVANEVALGIRDKPDVLVKREKALDKREQEQEARQQEQEAFAGKVRKYIKEFREAYNGSRGNKLSIEARNVIDELDEYARSIETNLDTNLYDDKEYEGIEGEES